MSDQHKRTLFINNDYEYDFVKEYGNLKISSIGLGEYANGSTDNFRIEIENSKNFITYGRTFGAEDIQLLSIEDDDILDVFHIEVLNALDDIEDESISDEMMLIPIESIVSDGSDIKFEFVKNDKYADYKRQIKQLEEDSKCKDTIGAALFGLLIFIIAMLTR